MMLIFKLAMRNVLRNRHRSLLTILSMGGGFFLLCTMISFTEGSYSNMIDIFTGDQIGHVQVHKDDYLVRPSLYKTLDANELMPKLLATAQVTALAPRIYSPSLAYGKDKTYPANVIGISPELEAKTTRLESKVNQGQYLTNGMTSEGYFPAMLGYSLAKNLSLTIGDELVLISQGIDGSIANDIFIISAIVGSANSNERMNVYLSIPAMASFLSLPADMSVVHELAIALKHQGLAMSFANEWQKKLSSNDLSVDPWQVVESAFYNGMQADKSGNYVSLGIIVFIISIGVLNTVLMGTLERTREFGVLKAIGTQPSAVFYMIMLESFLLSFASCILGLLLAMPLVYWLSTAGLSMPEPIDMGGVMFDSILAELTVFSVFAPFVVIIGTTLLVSLIPAIRAAKISPLQALQAV